MLGEIGCKGVSCTELIWFLGVAELNVDGDLRLTSNSPAFPSFSSSFSSHAEKLNSPSELRGRLQKGLDSADPITRIFPLLPSDENSEIVGDEFVWKGIIEKDWGEELESDSKLVGRLLTCIGCCCLSASGLSNAKEEHKGAENGESCWGLKKELRIGNSL